LVVENDATATRRRSTARGTSQRDNVRPLHSENVHGPSVECCSALTSKVMPLIDGGNPKQLRRLVRQKLVDYDAVKAERRELRDPRSSEIVQAPCFAGRRLASDLSSSPRSYLGDCPV